MSFSTLKRDSSILDGDEMLEVFIKKRKCSSSADTSEPKWFLFYSCSLKLPIFISDGDLILGVNKKYWSLAFLHKHLEDIAAVLCQVTFTHEQLKARNAAKGDVNKIESLPHQIRHAVMCAAVFIYRKLKPYARNPWKATSKDIMTVNISEEDHMAVERGFLKFNSVKEQGELFIVDELVAIQKTLEGIGANSDWDSVLEEYEKLLDDYLDQIPAQMKQLKDMNKNGTISDNEILQNEMRTKDLIYKTAAGLLFTNQTKKLGKLFPTEELIPKSFQEISAKLTSKMSKDVKDLFFGSFQIGDSEYDRFIHRKYLEKGTPLSEMGRSLFRSSLIRFHGDKEYDPDKTNKSSKFIGFLEHVAALPILLDCIRFCKHFKRHPDTKWLFESNRQHFEDIDHGIDDIEIAEVIHKLAESCGECRVDVFKNTMSEAANDNNIAIVAEPNNNFAANEYEEKSNELSTIPSPKALCQSTETNIPTNSTTQDRHLFTARTGETFDLSMPPGEPDISKNANRQHNQTDYDRLKMYTVRLTYDIIRNDRGGILQHYISSLSIDGFDDFLITGNGFEARAGIAQASRAAARGYQAKVLYTAMAGIRITKKGDYDYVPTAKCLLELIFTPNEIRKATISGRARNQYLLPGETGLRFLSEPFKPSDLNSRSEFALQVFIFLTEKHPSGLDLPNATLSEIGSVDFYQDSFQFTVKKDVLKKRKHEMFTEARNRSGKYFYCAKTGSKPKAKAARSKKSVNIEGDGKNESDIQPQDTPSNETSNGEEPINGDSITNHNDDVTPSTRMISNSESTFHHSDTPLLGEGEETGSISGDIDSLFLTDSDNLPEFNWKDLIDGVNEHDEMLP